MINRTRKFNKDGNKSRCVCSKKRQLVLNIRWPEKNLTERTRGWNLGVHTWMSYRRNDRTVWRPASRTRGRIVREVVSSNWRPGAERHPAPPTTFRRNA